jgi:predicted TIM-barrel fold metal-dependent hydrolase
MTDMVMSKVGMAEPLANLVYGGVLERFPALRVVLVEGQIGWIPFVRLYMDHIYHKHRFWTKSDLPQLPSVYLDRQVSATFMEDEVGLRERHAIGVGNIMWSSDYPHSETTWPDSRKLIAKWFRGIPEDEKRQIVRDNARALYRL